MQNFVFHNPTKILFGRGRVAELGPEAKAWGQRALLVTGRASARKNGLLARVQASLAAAGIHAVELTGIRSNPGLSRVHQGIALVRQHHLEVIIAVGGGSVIDTAKAISAGSLVSHDVWKFFTGKKSIRAALPVITLLTLAGSGSEMNQGMVITNEQTREKFGCGNRHLYPKVSILDPEVTFTVPPDYTAYGAVDAIAHVLEFYMTTQDPQTPVQDRIMEGLIINGMERCDQCLRQPDDYPARANLMWTATLALNGLTGAGLGRVGFPMHMIEHALSALYDVPHGAGLAVIIPAWLKWYAQHKPSRIAHLGQRIFPLADERLPDTELLAQRTITLLRNWFISCNCPTTLEELEISKNDIPRIAANAQALARVWRLKEYSLEVITSILHNC